MKTNYSAIILLVGYVSRAFSFSGVATSELHRYVWPHEYEARVHKIENNKVVQHTTLMRGDNKALAENRLINWVGRPVINTLGTHVAFAFQDAQGYHLTVMRADGSSFKRRDIGTETRIDFTEWPRGDWVFYFTGATLKKANVLTGEIQTVTTFTHGIPSAGFEMSADGQLIVVTWPKPLDAGYMLKAPFPSSVNTAKWDEGGNLGFGGCGHCISPSGLYAGCQFDAGHNSRVFYSLDHSAKKTTAVATLKVDWWNRHSVDSELAITCTGRLYPLTVGAGIHEPGNRYSRNSDKWIVLQNGWNGRFADCGLNLVVMNWQDSLTLNVTRYPANPDADDKVFSASCSPLLAKERHMARFGDLWVREPVADVYEPLREDLQESRRSAYKVPCVDIDGVNCPKELVFGPSPVRPSLSNVSKKTSPVRVVALQNGGIRISGSNLQGVVTQIYGLDGTILLRRTIQSQSAVISANDLPHGAYLLTVSLNSGLWREIIPVIK